MLKLAMDGIFNFSSKPLTLPFGLGIGLGFLGGLGLIAMIVLTAIYGSACPQWLWAVVGGVILHAVTLCCIGVHGMYLGRMYDELKDRPLYIVAETLNADDPA